MDNIFFRPQPLARMNYGNCCKQSINVSKEKMATNQKQSSARKTFKKEKFMEDKGKHQTGEYHYDYKAFCLK